MKNVLESFLANSKKSENFEKVKWSKYLELAAKRKENGHLIEIKLAYNFNLLRSIDRSFLRLVQQIVRTSFPKEELKKIDPESGLEIATAFAANEVVSSREVFSPDSVNVKTLVIDSVNAQLAEENFSRTNKKTRKITELAKTSSYLLTVCGTTDFTLENLTKLLSEGRITDEQYDKALEAFLETRSNLSKQDKTRAVFS